MRSVNNVFHVNAGFMRSLQHLEELNRGQGLIETRFLSFFQSSGCSLPDEDFQRYLNQRCFEAERNRLQQDASFKAVFFLMHVFLLFFTDRATSVSLRAVSH